MMYTYAGCRASIIIYYVETLYVSDTYVLRTVGKNAQVEQQHYWSDVEWNSYIETELSKRIQQVNIQEKSFYS